MKKRITALSLCLLGLMFVGASHAQAQSTFGIKGGLSLYSISFDASVAGLSASRSTDSKIGFGAGLFMEIPVSDIFSIQPEALFVQKGGSEDGGSDDIFEGESGDATLSYIDIPVFLKANIPVDGEVRPFLMAGPMMGYLIDAQADGEDISEVLSSLNYGVSLGGGISFGNLIVDIRYDIGLGNIVDDSEYEDLGDIGDFSFEATTSGLLVTLGLAF